MGIRLMLISHHHPLLVRFHCPSSFTFHLFNFAFSKYCSAFQKFQTNPIFIPIPGNLIQLSAPLFQCHIDIFGNPYLLRDRIPPNVPTPINFKILSRIFPIFEISSIHIPVKCKVFNLLIISYYGSEKRQVVIIRERIVMHLAFIFLA
jgi:hypothetical protein